MQIEFKKSVEKDLKKIDQKNKDLIFTKIKSLGSFPNILGIKKLTGAKDYFRLRTGDYRVIFRFLKNEKKILIYYIRHRKFVYKQL